MSTPTVICVLVHATNLDYATHMHEVKKILAGSAALVLVASSVHIPYVARHAAIPVAQAASEWTVSTMYVSSTLSGSSSSYLNDGDTSTYWSSEEESSASSTEWVAYDFDTYHSTNYIKIYPRYNAGEAQAFPVDLNVQYSNGTSWVDVDLLNFTDFPVPQEDWIILPLGQTVTAKGLRVNATQLGQNTYSDYYFRLAEVGGGYDEGFETLELIDFDADSGFNLFEDVGAGPFDPNKISNWNYDYRLPIYESDCSSRQNVYSAQAEWNDATQQWYMYYGGNDDASNTGCDATNDRIFYLPTDEEFQIFSEGDSQMIIDNGEFRNANNPALTRTPDGQWAMVYTAGWCDASYGTADCRALGDENDLPAYAVSSDGLTWAPDNPGDPFGTNNLIAVDNWHGGDWAASQWLNNQSGLLYDHGLYWYYYGPEGLGGKDYRAYSTDMVNFTDTDYVMDGAMASVNDVKKFRFGGDEYYMMVAHHNGQQVYYSVSTDPASFPVLQTLFSTTGITEGDESVAQDNYIVSAGIVADTTTLYGVLYGAAETSSLNTNKIFAKWLQKKVYFSNEDVGYGGIERADGPKKVRLGLDGANDIQTGNIYIYDTDGTTLLFTSPEVTLVSGMHWQYNEDETCGPSNVGDWTLTEDCTISDDRVAPATVNVQNNATLTIESTGSLDIDFENYALRIQNGSRVRVILGGKMD